MATTDNLREAFAGESQARNMYTFFAQVARKEGFHYIAKIFEETAVNEMRHAKDEFVLAGALDDGPHVDERSGQVENLRLPGGVFDHRFPLRGGGGHHRSPAGRSRRCRQVQAVDQRRQVRESGGEHGSVVVEHHGCEVL